MRVSVIDEASGLATFGRRDDGTTTRRSRQGDHRGHQRAKLLPKSRVPGHENPRGQTLYSCSLGITLESSDKHHESS